MQNSVSELKYQIDGLLERVKSDDKVTSDLRKLGVQPPVIKREKSPRGFIYFIQDTITGLIKIGWAKHPQSRLDGLQTGSAGKLTLLGAFEGTVKDEKGLHRLMADKWVRGEWFENDGNIVQYIKGRNTLANGQFQ